MNREDCLGFGSYFGVEIIFAVCHLSNLWHIVNVSKFNIGWMVLFEIFKTKLSRLYDISQIIQTKSSKSDYPD